MRWAAAAGTVIAGAVLAVASLPPRSSEPPAAARGTPRVGRASPLGERRRTAPRATLPAPQYPAGAERGEPTTATSAHDVRVVHVRVLREDGEPACGAQVATLGARRQRWSSADTLTDEAGRARVETRATGELRVHASWGATAGLSAPIPADAPACDVTLRLEPARTLRGRLVSAGEGVAEAELSFSHWGDDAEARLCVALRTDTNGAFVLPALPAALLGAGTSGFSAERHACMPLEYTLWNGELDEPELELRLEPALVVRGRLVAADGSAVEGASIDVGDGNESRSAGDGTFVLPTVRVGTTELRVDSRSHVLHTLHLPSDAVGECDAGTIVLAEGRAIRGVVVDEEGAPRAGVRVRALSEALHWFARESSTGDDGAFVIEHLDEGQHWVCAETPIALGNSLRSTKAASVERVATGAVGLRLVLRALPALTARIAAEGDHAPVELRTASIRLWREDGRPAPSEWRLGNEPGTARVSVLYEGRHTLSVDVPGYDAASVSGIEMTRADARSVDVVLRVTR